MGGEIPEKKKFSPSRTISDGIEDPFPDYISKLPRLKGDTEFPLLVEPLVVRMP